MSLLSDLSLTSATASSLAALTLTVLRIADRRRQPPRRRTSRQRR